jgi:hypothetical protein
VVAHDERGANILDGPGRREAAGQVDHPQKGKDRPFHQLTAFLSWAVLATIPWLVGRASLFVLARR